MAATIGIDDFEGREFNPDISPRREYIEGYLFALALALGEFDATNGHEPSTAWIDYFRENFAAEIMEKGYQAGLNKLDGEF